MKLSIKQIYSPSKYSLKGTCSPFVVKRTCYFYNDNMVLVGPYKLHLTVYSPYYHCTFSNLIKSLTLSKMEIFIKTWPLWIYLIGIPITYAIMEDPKDKGPFEAAPMVAVLWPVMLLYCIYTVLAYPFYWITKKIKNKLKH